MLCWEGMEVCRIVYMLLISSLCLMFNSGLSIDDIFYDYSATTECLLEPQRISYGGGILLNPDFSQGLKGWEVYGEGKVEERVSKAGNKFIVASSRRLPSDSCSHKIQLEKGMIYSFSAWVQINEGSEAVSVIFRTTSIGNYELTRGGQVIASQGCWSLLKGGIVANLSSAAEILFECKNTAVEIWVDNVSLQPFTKKQWRSHQDNSIDKIRKRKVKFQITDTNQSAIEGAKVLIQPTKPGFPFGCGMNYNILKSTDYQNWFASRFKFTTFTNEMKWYSTEKKQGEENYTTADAMVKFAKQKGISIRGHNIFWDDPKYQPDWVRSLSPEELRKAAAERINSVVIRYKGELIAWDVVNENLHFSFYEDRLGRNASAEFYHTAYMLDPDTTMFMNEYNTIEYSEDEVVSAVKYKKKLEEILSFPGNNKLPAGIGLQGHFGSGQPNLAYMRSALDILATTGLPIWLTEVDVEKHANQAEYLEEILREGFSHPAVEGVIMFAGPAIAGFKFMPLADENFNNTAAGDVVDSLITEWKAGPLEVQADSRGFVDVSLFYGDYNVTIIHPAINSSKTQSFRVIKDTPQESLLHIQIQA